MALKIASCTGGFRNLSLEETLTILDELGFEYVEGTTDGRAHIYPYLFEGKDWAELEALLARFKVKLAVISGGWSDFAVADRLLDAQYDSLRKQFDLCQRLKVKVLRIFAAHIPLQYIDDAITKRVIRNIKRLAPEAESRGLTLALENHYGVTANADDILRIIEGVASPALKVNFDAANFLPMKQDPVAACRKLLPHIAHAHLKDANYTGKGRFEGYEYCEIGKGIVDYRTILSLLKETGYNGVLSVEYEHFDDVVRGTIIARRNLRKVLSEIGWK